MLLLLPHREYPNLTITSSLEHFKENLSSDIAGLLVDYPETPDQRNLWTRTLLVRTQKLVDDLTSLECETSAALYDLHAFIIEGAIVRRGLILHPSEEEKKAELLRIMKALGLIK